MEPEHRNHDETIDKTLAALRDAAPPEGMKTRIGARIAERIQQRAALAPAAEFRWRDVFAGSTLAGAWGRGAVSGAAAAMLVAGMVLLGQHGLRTGSGRGPGHGLVAVNQAAAQRVVAPSKTPSDQALGNPCAAPRVLPVPSTAPARTSDTLSAEAQAAVNAPSHPAPVLPLTAEEQALAELARTASPKVLATLSPETEAKVEAQEEENFNKFFAPPPAPPQSVDSESTTNTNQTESQL